MSKIIGIDLGTTNSLIATVDSGIPLVLADRQGQRLTPSVVNFPTDGAAPAVGHLANRRRLLEPASTVSSIKRFMGRRFRDLSVDELRVSYPIEAGDEGQVAVSVGGKRWRPEEISAEVLKTLKAEAEAAMGETVSRAVITVPAYFNDAQRQATKRAGELAGFSVERILNEPTAAALAYGLNRLSERSKIAVYDLGGGTFDLSILELTDGVFQVLSTQGNTCLGGDDLDRKIVEFLIEQIARAGGPDLRGEGGAAAAALMRARLREAAEQAKIRLSSDLQTEITLPFLTPEFSFTYLLTREELERLTAEIIERTHTHCVRALADAKLESADLDQVILVGGQTRMPLVRQKVSEWFRCVDFEETRGGLRLGQEYHRAKGPLLNTSQNPDEAVALGAAIQAEILSGGFSNVLLLDVTPLSLGIETFGGLMNVIIPRNTTIPVKAGEMFTTAVDFQKSMLIHVLQGERERAKDNWSLGRFTLEFAPAPKGVARVGVQFEIDANGILQVLARDVQTGQQKIVEIQSVVDVEDAAVQEMVEESVEHAFADLSARRWIEGKQRATETVQAARAALAQCGDEVDPDYRQQIEVAVESVSGALLTEDPATGSGDLARLKSALAILDEVTKPLAEQMMDRAVEALLRQRGLLT